jgi:hypothetical protein
MDILFLLFTIGITALVYIIPTIIILGLFALVISWIVDRNVEPYDLSDDVGDFYCPVCKDTTDWCSHGP